MYDAGVSPAAVAAALACDSIDASTALSSALEPQAVGRATVALSQAPAAFETLPLMNCAPNDTSL